MLYVYHTKGSTIRGSADSLHVRLLYLVLSEVGKTRKLTPSLSLLLELLQVTYDFPAEELLLETMSISKLKKLSYLCITMGTSRIYHSYHLDISQNGSNRVCYIILPERLKEYSSSRYNFSLGEKEKDGKNLRLAAVEKAITHILA